MTNAESYLECGLPVTAAIVGIAALVFSSLVAAAIGLMMTQTVPMRAATATICGSASTLGGIVALGLAWQIEELGWPALVVATLPVAFGGLTILAARSSALNQ